MGGGAIQAGPAPEPRPLPHPLGAAGVGSAILEGAARANHGPIRGGTAVRSLSLSGGDS